MGALGRLGDAGSGDLGVAGVVGLVASGLSVAVGWIAVGWIVVADGWVEDGWVEGEATFFLLVCVAGDAEKDSSMAREKSASAGGTRKEPWHFGHFPRLPAW